MIEKLLKMITFLYSPVDEIPLFQVDRFWSIHVSILWEIFYRYRSVLVEVYDKNLAKNYQKYTTWFLYQALNTAVRERIDP